jgi:hypothetical protein
LREWE